MLQYARGSSLHSEARRAARVPPRRPPAPPMILCIGPCCIPLHAAIPLLLWLARALLPEAYAARADRVLRCAAPRRACMHAARQAQMCGRASMRVYVC